MDLLGAGGIFSDMVAFCFTDLFIIASLSMWYTSYFFLGSANKHLQSSS